MEILISYAKEISPLFDIEKVNHFVWLICSISIRPSCNHNPKTILYKNIMLMTKVNGGTVNA